jgi:hypothetical protein
MGESTPWYHIDCSPGLKYDIVMTGFDNVGDADGYDRTYTFPQFIYAGRKYGGGMVVGVGLLSWMIMRCRGAIVFLKC